MYGCRRNPEFRPLGHFVPVAVNSGLRPETPLCRNPHKSDRKSEF